MPGGPARMRGYHRRMQTVDIAIIGGGLVGSSLACALEGAGLSVLMLEAQPPRASAPSSDERSLALARRSVQVLDAYGVFTHARGEAQPIRAVHVTSRGDFGAVRIRAEDYGLDALGYTCPARAVGAALEARLAVLASLTRWTNARLVAIEPGDATNTLAIERDGTRESIAARLVVGADGTESFVRTALGIDARRTDYAQTAIVTTIQPSKPHEQVAYERFGATGPMALLPLANDRCGMVWTFARDRADEMLALDDDAFVAAAEDAFGSRLGRLRRIGRRQAWPLARVEATSLVGPRAVLVGNAAQTIHPIGAQGFNLGLRDVATLVDGLRGAVDPGDAALLRAYAERREPDRRQTADTSEAMLRLFAPQGELARLARGAGLALLDRLPPLKRELAFAMMGYRDEAPT